MVVSPKHFKMSEPGASQNLDNHLRGHNEEKSVVRPMLIVKRIHNDTLLMLLPFLCIH
jgi:hypothetical protein